MTSNIPLKEDVETQPFDEEVALYPVAQEDDDDFDDLDIDFDEDDFDEDDFDEDFEDDDDLEDDLEDDDDLDDDGTWDDDDDVWDVLGSRYASLKDMPQQKIRRQRQSEPPRSVDRPKRVVRRKRAAEEED